MQPVATLMNKVAQTGVKHVILAVDVNGNERGFVKRIKHSINPELSLNSGNERLEKSKFSALHHQQVAK